MSQRENFVLHFAIFLIFIIFMCSMFILDIKTAQPLYFHPPKTLNDTNGYPEDLDDVLAAAATSNRTVIIAVVNKAYVEGEKPMLDLFLAGFRVGQGTQGLVKHLVIVAMDRSSYERCRFLGLHCYKLETEGVEFVGEKVYMSEDFIKMMWRRTLFLLEVLKRGYSFIFTDIDVLWLRNPFPILNPQPQLPDLQISTDKFKGDKWASARRANTGFYMIQSNNKTVALFDIWYAHSQNSTGLKDQDVLQRLMRQSNFRNLNLGVRFLDTVYFSGFCQDSSDVAEVATVHANCCRGMAAKMTDLTAVLRDWERYRSLLLPRVRRRLVGRLMRRARSHGRIRRV